MKIKVLNLKLALMLASFLFGFAKTAQAYQVESGSYNELFILLINDNPGAVFHSVTVVDTLPSFVDYIVATTTPSTITGGKSDLLALDFELLSSASIGDSGDIILAVSGTAAGTPLTINITVPLEVVANTVEAQGIVGTGIPQPDPGGVDTDGDGVTDSLETAFGSDPNSASSIPGQTETSPEAEVPFITPIATIFLALSLFLLGRASVIRIQNGSVK